MFRIYEILGLSYKQSYDTVIRKGYLFILQNSLCIEYSWCKDGFGRHYKKKEKVKIKQIIIYYNLTYFDKLNWLFTKRQEILLKNVKRLMRMIKLFKVSSSKSLSYGFWCDPDYPNIYHTIRMIAHTKGCTKVTS